MRALTVTPGRQSGAELVEVPEPSAEEGAVLVRTVVQADPAWLESMITRTVDVGSFAEAVAAAADDIKAVLLFDTPTGA